MLKELLPSNSTGWEVGFADTVDPSVEITGAIVAIRGTKLIAPPPSFLPWLVYEYGLGELTPYVPNLYNLIDVGIDWQRIRGTPAAIAMGLGFIGYEYELEEESTQRRYWNIFQTHLDRVRDTFADLARIDGVVSLSVPKRSRFFRGFHGFDIRPLTYGESHWSEAHWMDYSGVRTRVDGPKWSFGRAYNFVHEMAESELQAISVWLPPTGEGDLGWGEITWDETEATWDSSAARARREAMAAQILARGPWMRFRDAQGAVIGYRRARAASFVTPSDSGPYEVAGVRYLPQATAQDTLYLEFMTAFGEGNGRVATEAAIVLDGEPIGGLKPGLSWLGPGQMTMHSAPIAVQTVNIAFGESIRERVRVLLHLADAVATLPEGYETTYFYLGF